MEGQLDWKLGACWRPRLSSWWELLNRPWCFCTECKYLQPDVRPWAVLGEGVAPRVQVLPLWVQIFFFSPSTLSMARKPAGMSRSCEPRAVWRVSEPVTVLLARGLMFWF